MKAELLSLDNKKVGEVDLNDSIFGLEVRIDIIKRVVDWQRAKAMSGTHKTKTESEVSGTTRKPFKQKGTGNARQGSRVAVRMRGGGISHGPQVRSHATKLQKKVRSLGMKYALSMKKELGSLFVIDSVDMKEPKTKVLASQLEKFGKGKFFIIDGKEVNANLKLSVNSLARANAVPTVGANVYDIVNSDFVLISKDALPLLEERLK